MLFGCNSDVGHFLPENLPSNSDSAVVYEEQVNGYFSFSEVLL